MTKLNLGSSRWRMDGWVNVDCRKLDGVDVVADLEHSWPWDTSSIDEIYTSHCFEHLHDVFHALRECHRVLKDGGKITIIVPNGRGMLALCPSHHCYFSRTWFESLADSDDYQDDWTWMFSDCHITLHLVHNKLPWCRPVGALIKAWDRFWNKSPRRQFIWDSAGFLPPQEVKFVATIRKPPSQGEAGDSVNRKGSSYG